MAEKSPVSSLLSPEGGGGENKSTSSPILLFTDGASRGNPGLSGIGVVIEFDDGTTLEERKFLGEATNNTAEYEALIHGLTLLRGKGISRPLKIYSDSQLMVRQLNGQYKIRQPHLKKLARRVHDLLKSFPSHEIIHIPRGQNKHADKLANEAIDKRER